MPERRCVFGCSEGEVPGDRCPNVGVCLGARKGKCLGCWDRRDDRRRLRPWCSLLAPADAAWGDGWPSRGRAVDAPALQDVPAWDGIVAWLSRSVTMKRTPLEPGRVSFAERL